MMFRKIKFGQCGRSALEMVGVLVIVAILTVGGIAGFSKATPKQKMSRLADQAAVIITNIRAAYSIKNNYDGLTTLAAIQMGAISADMVRVSPATGQKEAFNAFGGHIFLAPAADKNSVFITLSGLPAAACTFLASSDWGGQMGNGVVSIATLVQAEEAPVSAQLQNNIGKAENNTLPLSAARAAAGCGGSGQKSAVVIQYK